MTEHLEPRAVADALQARIETAWHERSVWNYAAAEDAEKELARYCAEHKDAILAALRAPRPAEPEAVEDDYEPFDPNNPKLEPCPFCGGEAELVEIDDMTDENCGGTYVACKTCEASTNLRFSAGDDARPLVCEQWNARAALRPADPGPGVEAALRDMLSGWRYIRQTHGDLSGVGWDRCQDAAEAAIAALPQPASGDARAEVERAATRIADATLCQWAPPGDCGRDGEKCLCEAAARAALAQGQTGDGRS